MSYQAVKQDAQTRFEKTIQHLQELMRGIRTGRATTALVENVRMDYYGTPTPLQQLASISIPEPRQIILKPFDPSVLKEMAKALMKTDLGCAPQEDGKLLRLSLPPLSGEQRSKYAAKVKEMAEESRIAMRNTRRDLNKASDAMDKSGEITQDENHRLHAEVQELLRTYEKKVDDLLGRKVAEIEEV
ncbi:MAG: ribosome recycling factor [Planctomycetota bacterium]|nr:ribosome recycling factor [Planctomycetota bacterium]